MPVALPAGAGACGANCTGLLRIEHDVRRNLGLEVADRAQIGLRRIDELRRCSLLLLRQQIGARRLTRGRAGLLFRWGVGSFVVVLFTVRF